MAPSQRPVTVLHATEALGGGVQSAIANYIDGLPELRHSMFSRAREGQATHAWTTRAVKHESYSGSLPGFFARLREKVQTERPDVVHLHSSLAGAARLVLPKGTRIVYSPHCYAMERTDIAAPVRAAYGVIEWMLARRRQTTVAVSPREASISARLNRRTPATVVLNPSPFDPEADVLPRAERSGEIVMVGRILPQKDPALFAAVASSLRGRGKRFVWIGDGDDPARDELVEAGVEIAGWMEPARLRERLRRASLYLHTAAWEGGPVSAVEAAALGVPVLSRDIPSMRSLDYALAGSTPQELARAVALYFDSPAYARSVDEATAAIPLIASKERMAAALRSAYTSAASELTSRGLPSAR